MVNTPPYLDGVYALSFLYGIANDVGADCTLAHTKMGRGFQAGELNNAIHKAMQAAEVVT